MIRWLDRNQPAILSLVMLLILATMYATGVLSAPLATLEIGPVAAGALRVIFASIFLLFVATITGAGHVTLPLPLPFPSRNMFPSSLAM